MDSIRGLNRQRAFFSLWLGLLGAGGAGCPGSPAPVPSTETETGPARLVLSVSTTALTEDEPLRLVGILVDPSQRDRLTGGELVSSDGALRYGSFQPAADGSYQLDLSWAALHQVAPIRFASEEQRSLRAIFTDSQGATTTRDLTVRLYCKGVGVSACDGHCLAGGASCGGGKLCVAGVCGPGCYINQVLQPPQSLDPIETCHSCEPATAQLRWTDKPDGSSCGGTATCTAGRCSQQTPRIPIDITDNITSVWGSGPKDMYLVTFGGLILRTNNGWGSYSNVTPTGSVNPLRGVWAKGPSEVYAVGNFGTIYHTVNGGATWAQPSSGGTSILWGVWGAGASVYVVGNFGVMLKSSDGGATFGPQSIPTAETLRAVWGSDENNVVAVGDNGAVIHTSNGGASWSAVSAGVSTTFYALFGTSATNLYASGTNGTLMRSTNGGQSWTVFPSLGASVGTVRAVWGSGPDNVFGSCSTGAVFRTRDGGQSFSPVDTGGTTNSLNAIWGAAGSEGYAVGNSGSIVRLQ